jgi:hypothetical protein
VSEPSGAVSPDAGLVVADFYRAEPGGLDGLVELFVLSAYRDSRHCADLRAAWRDSRPWGSVLEGASRPPQSAEGVATLQLRPTARSLIRYRDGGSR